MALAGSSKGEDTYPVPPESIVQDGVPKGTTHGPFELRSRVFPGTVREYWVYVPVQYDAQHPPCLMLVQDGISRADDWKLTTVLDNLIHSGSVPVQIGIFVNPGLVPASTDIAQPRFNRSYEYDALGDRYARFLLEELLPAVGERWNYSSDPNDRCIAGASSGAICAFNAAWERPDAFRRVLSTIGTYVSLRGADVFPALIRKSENKPIRVFLQDGSNDNDIFAGSWWYANQSMLSAFQYAGYDVHHVWGEGGHNGRHSAAILPDALRWLWRNYPEPIVPGKAKERRVDVLKDGEHWQKVSDEHHFTEGPAVNAAGELFFSDISTNRIHRLATDNTVSVFAEHTGAANGLAIGPDNALYACRHADGQIVRYSSDGKSFSVVAEGIHGNDLILLHNGGGYCTDPDHKTVWYFTSGGEKKEVDTGIDFPNGLAASPDQTQLLVTDTNGRFCFSFMIQQDGTLAAKQEYGWLHVTDHLRSDADGAAADTEGRYYVATSEGVQILDALGRVTFIIEKPQSAWLSNVTFGGPAWDTLYATCGSAVYRRKLKATGAMPWKPPVSPPKPRL